MAISALLASSAAAVATLRSSVTCFLPPASPVTSFKPAVGSRIVPSPRPWAVPVLRASSANNEDEDLPDRALDFLTRAATALSNDVRVPASIVPLRPGESGRETTLKGWYLLASGLSLTLGNLLFPTTFLGFLYVSRPVDAPDAAAAVAAVLTSAVASPIFSSIGDALDVDEWPLARLPLVVGLVSMSLLLREVTKEGQAAFVQPAKAMKDPQLKSKRDLKFFDVKLNTSSSSAEEEKKDEGPRQEGGGVGGRVVVEEEEQPAPAVERKRRDEREDRTGKGGRWR